MKQSYSCITISTFNTLLLFTLFLTTCNATRLPPTATLFITSSCKKAQYPHLCISSLSPYFNTIQSNPTQLVRVSLSVSLSAVRSTSDMVRKMSTGRGAKPREVSAVSDCVLTMGDAVAQLEKSVEAMARFGGKGARQQMGDVQTWVSTALTEESSCKDGFEGSDMDVNVKKKVNGMVEKAVQLTCIALSLVNQLASTVSTRKGP